jgi:hypothetical protein
MYLEELFSNPCYFHWDGVGGEKFVLGNHDMHSNYAAVPTASGKGVDQVIPTCLHSVNQDANKVYGPAAFEKNHRFFHYDPSLQFHQGKMYIEIIHSPSV